MGLVTAQNKTKQKLMSRSFSEGMRSRTLLFETVVIKASGCQFSSSTSYLYPSIFRFLNFNTLSIYLLSWLFIYYGGHATPRGGQRTLLSLFPTPTLTWALGMEFRSAGLGSKLLYWRSCLIGPRLID